MGYPCITLFSIFYSILHPASRLQLQMHRTGERLQWVKPIIVQFDLNSNPIWDNSMHIMSAEMKSCVSSQEQQTTLLASTHDATLQRHSLPSRTTVSTPSKSAVSSQQRISAQQERSHVRILKHMIGRWSDIWHHIPGVWSVIVCRDDEAVCRTPRKERCLSARRRSRKASLHLVRNTTRPSQRHQHTPANNFEHWDHHDQPLYHCPHHHHRCPLPRPLWSFLLLCHGLEAIHPCQERIRGACRTPPCG